MLSEEESRRKTNINTISQKSLDTITFLDKKEIISSPRSLEALGLLGYNIKKLYHISFESYIKNHPELKNFSQEIQERRYNHFEEIRLKKINEAKNKREELISIKKNKKMLKSKSTSEYFTEQESTILKNEKEKLNNLKNQQIRELKNLIEFEFKVQEMRKKNEEKLKLQEQKEEEKLKLRLKRQKEKEIEQKLLDKKKEERLKLFKNY
jgi:hypothetical protein